MDDKEFVLALYPDAYSRFEYLNSYTYKYRIYSLSANIVLGAGIDFLHAWKTARLGLEEQIFETLKR